MKKSTLIILLLSLLAVGSVAVWRLVPRTLKIDECSDVYRHFVDMQLDGVHVTFIRDKLIGDSLRLPVTLLQAETDEGWEAIDNLFGYTRQIEEILDDPEIPDSVKSEFVEYTFSFYSYRANSKAPESIIKSDGFSPDDVLVYIFHNKRCVTIYEPTNVKKERMMVSGYAITSQAEMERSEPF